MAARTLPLRAPGQPGSAASGSPRTAVTACGPRPPPGLQRTVLCRGPRSACQQQSALSSVAAEMSSRLPPPPPPPPLHQQPATFLARVSFSTAWPITLGLSSFAFKLSHTQATSTLPRQVPATSPSVTSLLSLCLPGGLFSLRALGARCCTHGPPRLLVHRSLEPASSAGARHPCRSSHGAW